MEMTLKKELLEFCKEIAPEAECVFMDPKQAVFEECVKMNCFYCGKYGRNWRCPPNLPDIDYPKMFSEYDEGMFVAFTFDVTNKAQYESVRNESSVTLHKALLQIEKWFYDHNSSTAISFGAGSCKLCKGGCGKERCNNPYMSRSPLEATGVNIVKTAAKFGIDIKFPTPEKLMRVGLVLWQDPIL
ncbi:MAG: DUF2284 domain-containing protein [Ruminococcus sp.]|nr:DUF2284 domain-containing protein [Ruminococcus sp.]